MNDFCSDSDPESYEQQYSKLKTFIENTSESFKVLDFVLSLNVCSCIVPFTLIPDPAMEIQH